jgi:hypothetical protein
MVASGEQGDKRQDAGNEEGFMVQKTRDGKAYFAALRMTDFLMDQKGNMGHGTEPEG